MSDTTRAQIPQAPPAPQIPQAPQAPQIPNPKSRITSAVALACATVCGVGYAPIAPGTFGSAAGLILWWLLPGSAAVQAAVIAAIFVLGSWSGTVAEHHFGKTDPGQVVLDEVMGMLITLFLVPVGWKGAVGAFFLFRVADVIKPYPANRLERLPGGIGVMADDGMAAVYANIALHLVLAARHWVIG
jgi:phosphatidylglycerophosphatase A